MTKSIAYIGLSGPVCYDYKNILNRKYPNPILEAPLGLMILYDEVVFLHEAVFSKSMRKLEFVKFLSDRKDITDYLERIKQNRLDEYAKQIWQGSTFRSEKLKISPKLLHRLPHMTITLVSYHKKSYLVLLVY